MGFQSSFEFHARLNSPEVIPSGWYRRNVHQYQMLSYVNHVIALQIAGEWENAALFVREPPSTWSLPPTRNA